MAQPRRPLQLLKVTGGFRMTRHADRLAEPTSGPVGSPPDHLTADEALVWRELVDCQTVPGMWQSSDRHALEITAQLVCAARAGTLPDRMLGPLLTMFGRLGLTPVDRVRLHLQPHTPKPRGRRPKGLDGFL